MSLMPALLLALALPVGGADIQDLRTLAIQDGGRTKPLDTFARETARRVVGLRPLSGADSVKGLEPSVWVVSMLAEPQAWQDERMVKIGHAGLRRAIELPADRDRYSFRELAEHEPLRAAVQRLQSKGDEKLDPIEQETSTLYDTLVTLAAIFSGEGLRLLPRAGDPQAAWMSLGELGADTTPGAERARLLMGRVVGAYQAGDRPGMNAAAAELRGHLASLAPALYPAARDMEREVSYNRLKPFRTSWVLYLVGFLFLLASGPLASRVLGVAGTAFVVGAFCLHTYGLVLRTLISGRAPVTNMYESVVFAAWGAVLFALAFEAAHRVRFVATIASGLAVGCLVLADSLPILDGSIEPLAPVLRANLWLTVHVLTIMLGYAAFLLATGLAHVNLALHFFAPARTALFKTLTTFLYRSLQVGTLFLAAGTLLGGVWASYSWGRFWGWDPKETWALIALLGYLAVLHGRLLGWLKDVGLAVGSILGFLLVLMAWYGVNYVLGTGLHSYGFGSGGYGYVGGFLAVEALVLAATGYAHRARTPRVPALVPAVLGPEGR